MQTNQESPQTMTLLLSTPYILFVCNGLTLETECERCSEICQFRKLPEKSNKTPEVESIFSNGTSFDPWSYQKMISLWFTVNF